MARLALCALLAAFASPLTAGGGATHAHAGASGETFQKIEPAQPTTVDGKIEVLEIFWYGCPHCYAFEPYLDHWLTTRPADVEFVRMPGVLNASWVQHARAYYTAQKLGVLDKIHMPLFHAIHRDRQRVFSEDELREFFTEHGVDGDDFDRVFRSSEVDTRMKQALSIAKGARVTGVPAIIVNGRYLTTGTLTGSFEKMLEATDQLVAMERERLGTARAAAPAEPAPVPVESQSVPAQGETAPVAPVLEPAAPAPDVAPAPDAAPAPAVQPAAPAVAPAAATPETKSVPVHLIIAGLVIVLVVVVFALRARRNG